MTSTGVSDIILGQWSVGPSFVCWRHPVVEREPQVHRVIPNPSTPHFPSTPKAEVRHDAADHAAELVAVAGEAGSDERVVHGRVAVQE